MERTARKIEILSVSARLFRERGYSAVSMRDIAQALNIKAASLYNHIKSKQEILREIVIEIAEEFIEGIQEIVAGQGSVNQKLKQLILLHITITLRDPDEMACLNNDWMHLEDGDKKYYLKMRDEYEENFRLIIKEGIEQNEISDLNVDVIIFTMLSTLRTLYLWYGRKKTIRAEVLKGDLTQALLKGIIRNT
ncbi:MAG: TetR/AcrR family transcriptional regulator [Bacteroidia bacterium]